MIPTIDKIRTAQRLQQLMQQKGITPRGIQEYLSLSCVQTVYRWLEGVNIPSVDNLYALSCLLQVGIDDIIIGL